MRCAVTFVELYCQIVDDYPRQVILYGSEVEVITEFKAIFFSYLVDTMCAKEFRAYTKKTL